MGATEVRKYFSTFVTRPVYWFRQIVRERGSEIRDARASSVEQHETTIYRENVREREKVRDRVRERRGMVSASERIDAACSSADCDRRDDGS